jgi:hypothetical protein
MCDPVSLIVGAVAGLAVSKAMAPKQQQQQQSALPQQAAAPIPPPQTKTPAASAAVGTARQQQGGMGPGNASTLLTGGLGINPAALLLGRNDLLGK